MIEQPKVFTPYRSNVAAALLISAVVSGCGPGTLGGGDDDEWGDPSPPSTVTSPSPGVTPGTPPGPQPNVGNDTTSSPTSSGPGAVTPPPVGPTEAACAVPQPGRSPLRRLTRFEYSNTVGVLFGDVPDVTQRLPAELLGNGYGNDADNQPSSAFLIEQYSLLAGELAPRISRAEVASRYDACLLEEPQDEAVCVRSFVSKFAEAAYRRPLQPEELDGLLELQSELRVDGDLTASVVGVVEAILQSPDFLYRVEFGGEVADGVRRLTGHEMASRLSYFFWGAPPDDLLLEAAANGELDTAEGVRTQAERLLDDPRARRVIEFFFDSYLPIANLTDQARDAELFPTFSARIGELQRRETHEFLMNEIFDNDGSWRSVLTAPYTFVNEELANFYGIPDVQGEDFVKVDVDTRQRLGLLTHASVLTGTTVTNTTNPVRRGGFLLSHVLCIDVPLPSEDLLESITPPEPYSGKTGRDRFTAHSSDARCKGCHGLLDPPGFALENYDAVGLWRDTENDVTIDASGSLGAIGEFGGPVEMVRKLAESPTTYSCFAQQWQKFAYGRKLSTTDTCNRQQLTEAFAESGYNIKSLLLAVTQTDGFRYFGGEDQ
jgi:hypothetical protein